MKSMHTIIERLEQHAQQTPNALAYSFVHYRPEAHQQDITYLQLLTQVQALAKRLENKNLAHQSIVLIFEHELEFVISFLACILAQAVPVPLAIPRNERAFKTVLSIQQNCQAALWLVSERLQGKLNQICQPLNMGVSICSLSDLDDAPVSLSALKPKELCFLQYTSGSTGIPKGVMVSHQNILHNEALITQAFEHSETSRVVGWLPVFHDMGLIGNILNPLYVGVPSIVMSPLDFIQKPIRWLQLISQHQATTSGGPNFAYEHCVRRITPEQCESLDLSSWTLAFTGAERIRVETLSKFSQYFQPCGFNHHAFYPCYGLAESTLFVSGAKKYSGYKTLKISKQAMVDNRVEIIEPDDTQDASTYVSCGHIGQGVDVCIVNPDTLTPCEPNMIGEIWIASGSNAMGYWANESLTETMFRAQGMNQQGEKEQTTQFLRTGDLGFLINDELYYTGRIKDMLILRGQNYFPEDIEMTLTSLPDFHNSTIAVFASDQGLNEEALIVAIELKAEHFDAIDCDEAYINIIHSITQSYGIRPHDIVFVAARSLPKGTSGKLQRHLCTQYYEAQMLDVLSSYQRREKVIL